MPIIPLTLYGKDISLKVEAYVDSGAFYSIFNSVILKELQLDYKQGKDRMFIVGDGSFIPAKVFKIPIQIGEIKFISEIAFSDKLNIGFNLLGRKGIFEQFDEVIFREKKQEIEFKILDKR